MKSFIVWKMNFMLELHFVLYFPLYASKFLNLICKLIWMFSSLNHIDEWELSHFNNLITSKNNLLFNDSNSFLSRGSHIRLIHFTCKLIRSVYNVQVPDQVGHSHVCKNVTNSNVGPPYRNWMILEIKIAEE